MLEQQDIQKLMDVLATKEDILSVSEQLNELRETVNTLVTTLADGRTT